MFDMYVIVMVMGRGGLGSSSNFYKYDIKV